MSIKSSRTIGMRASLLVNMVLLFAPSHFVGAGLQPALAAEGGTLEAGAAKIDITPAADGADSARVAALPALALAAWEYRVLRKQR